MLTYKKVGNYDLVHPIHREEQFLKEIQVVICQILFNDSRITVASHNFESFQP